MRARAPVVIVAFAVFLAILGSNIPSPLYVVYQHRFGLSALVVTAIFSIYAAGVLFSLLVVGQASDALGDAASSCPPCRCSR
jgi:MFS family permease